MSRHENRHPIRHARDENDSADRPGKALSVLGVISVIGGVLSLVVGLIPCVGSLAIISGFIGLILGIVGLGLAGRHYQGKGMPVAGIVLNALSIVVSVAMMFFVLSAVTSPNSNVEAVEHGHAISISADKLATEYRSDPAKAELAYIDKVMEVTGRVLLVKWEYPHFVVVFGSGGTELSFRCDRGNNQLTPPNDISPGGTITIRGRCRGIVNRDKNTVYFDYCIASRSPKESSAPVVELPPAAVIDATKLLADFADNRESADRDYRGRYLEIKATVSRISQDPTGRYELLLNAASPAIYCNFPHAAAGQIQKLKVGDTVTVRGTCTGLGKHEVELQYCTLVE